MNEMPQSVPVSPAPADPVAAPVAANPAPVDPVAVAVNPAPVVMNPAPVAANPAPVVPVAAPISPANAPAAVEPDYRAMYENLRRENEILRQNAATAQRAPVQGVSGGVVTVPNDDFIRGFDSDTW